MTLRTRSSDPRVHLTTPEVPVRIFDCKTMPTLAAPGLTELGPGIDALSSMTLPSVISSVGGPEKYRVCNGQKSIRQGIMPIIPSLAFFVLDTERIAFFHPMKPYLKDKLTSFPQEGLGPRSRSKGPKPCARSCFAWPAKSIECHSPISISSQTDHRSFPSSGLH